MFANESQESDDADRTCDIRSQVLSMPRNPAADPIDWPVAMEAALDDVELLRSVAAAAFQEVSEHVRNLHTALDEGDAKLAQRSCHTVKNLLRTFGCTEPMQFTERIELSAKTGELDGLKPQAELLEQLVDSHNIKSLSLCLFFSIVYTTSPLTLKTNSADKPVISSDT